MATVNFTGFETGDNSEAAAALTGTASYQNTTARNGGYALRCNPATSALGYASLGGLTATGTSTTSAASIATSYIRFYFLYLTKPASGSERIMNVLTSAPANKILIYLNSSGQLVARDSGAVTVLGTGTTVLTSNTWYCIEVKCSTGASSAWEVRINGVSEISGTGNLGAGNAGWVVLGKAGNTSSQTIDCYYDDFFWSDSAYPGPGQCCVLLPINNGSNLTWTIGAGSGLHYQQVDEVPPDGDTTYLLSPLASGSVETEQLTDAIAAAGVSAGFNCVNSVKSLIIVKQNASAGTVTVRFISNGTNSDTASNYTTTAAYVGIGKLFDTDPHTSAAWVTLNLGFQTVIEVGAVCQSAVQQVRMTWCGVMVDWTPPDYYPVYKPNPVLYEEIEEEITNIY